MGTFTDSKMKEHHDKNFKIIWNALTSKEVPSGSRKLGNQTQRNSFSRVYLLYRVLHREWHMPEQKVGGINCTVENYRQAIVQALYAQPYHNLPDLPILYTGFKSKKAEEGEKNGRKPTKEHVYPRTPTLKIDLLDPNTPLSFEEFIYHFASKGGLWSKTTSTENRLSLPKYHGENPKAIENEHWREIYKKCGIEEA